MQNCLLKNKPASLSQTKPCDLQCEEKKKQEAAAAVALTSLLSLFHDVLNTKRASLLKQKVVPSLHSNNNTSQNVAKRGAGEC